MKKSWVIGLIVLSIILASNGAFCKDVSITYPPNVISGEVFQINLTIINFTKELYDIKIDIFNITTSNRISQIYDGTTWQSTNYYVNQVINTSISNSSIFLINITSNFNGTANLSINVRENGVSSSDSFRGYSINVTPMPIPLTCTLNSSCASWTTCSGNSQTRTCLNTSMDCSNLTYTETQSCTSSSTTTNTTTPNVTLEWDEDEIINGEEFKIKVITKNLLNKKYALKIWISFENDSGYTKSISDRYDENESKWESGTYWIYSFFSGPGNKTESINLRIRVDYSNFFGDAKILAKIKEDDNSDKFYDFLGSIEILKAIEHTTNNSYTSNAQPSILNANNSTNNITKNEVIILGTPKTSKKEANSIIYKSKVEYIREYAPYAFGLVCIFLIIILAIDKK